MTLSVRKCRFLYKKSGAPHYKVAPYNFYIKITPLLKLSKYPLKTPKTPLKSIFIFHPYTTIPFTKKNPK